MSIEGVPQAPVALWRWRAALLAPFLSLLVMRPWVPRAFPIWDYAEMLPLLRRSRGVVGTFLALAEFYRTDGRANFLTYAQIALTWGVTGDNPVGWQFQRALFMLVAALLLVIVARRLGARPLAAGLGGLLFTLAVCSTEGWLFLMGEPLAVILLLLLVLAAAGYRTTPAWRLRAVLIALLALGVMLSERAPRSLPSCCHSARNLLGARRRIAAATAGAAGTATRHSSAAGFGGRRLLGEGGAASCGA